jgi:hypothetical protein
MRRISTMEPILITMLILTGCDRPSVDGSSQQLAKAAVYDAHLDSSLVGYWKFDEGEGVTASDSSGNGNTATIVNGGWGNGKIGGALHMDGGNNSIVTVPLTDALRSTAESVTVMAWAYRTAPHNVDIIGHGYPALFLGFHGLQFKWQIKKTGGTMASCYADPKYRATLNQWFHLAGTYDGRTARLYVDGVQICSTWPWLSRSIEMPEVPFTISGYLGDSGEIVDEISGKIDDVRIYNRVLSADEVREIYNANL